MEIIDIIEEFLSFVAFCKDASLLEQSEISSQNNSIFSETKQVMLEARNNVEVQLMLNYLKLIGKQEKEQQSMSTSKYTLYIPDKERLIREVEAIVGEWHEEQ